MSTPAAKRQKSSKDVPYHLVYWPGLPGRGEHVRLALEEAGASYTDTAHIKDGINEVLAQIDSKNIGDDTSPPPLAPPILKHGDLTINQTPNILLYLGPKLGLAPKPGDDDEDGLFIVNELALTALDGLSNEPHDCHHPIASGLYYEDQKEESLRKSKDYVANRLPKFVGYFERVLKSKASGDGPWLYGGKLTYADLVLFQVSPVYAWADLLWGTQPYLKYVYLTKYSAWMVSSSCSPRPSRRWRTRVTTRVFLLCMKPSRRGLTSRNTWPVTGDKSMAMGFTDTTRS